MCLLLCAPLLSPPHPNYMVCQSQLLSNKTWQVAPDEIIMPLGHRRHEVQPGAPNLSMGVIFCGNHTLKCCLTAIRKFVQFRSSTSIRVLFTSNMCWHGRSKWMSRVRQHTVLSGAPATNRERSYFLPLCSLLTSEPRPFLYEDPLI